MEKLLSACKHSLVLDPSRRPLSPRRALPLTLRMLEHTVTAYSQERSDRSRWLVAVALTLAFFCMLRPSEYCRTRCNDHVLRADHVLFECRLAPHHTEFRGAHELQDIQLEQILLIKFMVTSAKNISFHVGASMWFSAASANPNCINLCTTMFLWAKQANLQPNDFFLSFRVSASGPSQHVSYRGLAKVIKQTAATFGFEPAFFSCYSTRIGGAPCCALQERRICLSCSWVAGSRYQLA